MNQSSISFWALPSRQTKEYYQNKINSLSERYKSNVFIPHITIYVGKSTFEESRVILSAFINKQQLTLIPLAVEASAELAKTFYISFKLNLELQSFCEYINDNMSSPSKYVFSPHMSLLYKKFKDNEYFSLLNREVV
ncbi:MAG: hypothetical protein KAI70_08455, partial [Candidatus Omnitrophica bacterium]|nr:hypothetical protein [Candidatus Omnitrophota bacterium]